MCCLCVELIKQRISLSTEAERAARELLHSSDDWDEMEHYAKLLGAIENLDLEALAEILEEGISEES